MVLGEKHGTNYLPYTSHQTYLSHQKRSIILPNPSYLLHQPLNNCLYCRSIKEILLVPCTAAMLKTYNSISTEEQVARDNLKITQTPQSFFIKDIVAAHREALEKGITNSVASCTMYIELGRKLYMSKGSEKNLKLTTTEDIEIFKALLQAKKDEWMH